MPIGHWALPKQAARDRTENKYFLETTGWSSRACWYTLRPYLGSDEPSLVWYLQCTGCRPGA